MSLRFGANLSLLFTEYPLLERFAAARSAGFHCVEVQFPYEHDPHAIARAAEEAEVELVLFNVPAGDLLQGGDGLACVPGRGDAFLRALDHAREYAAILRPTHVNLLAGRVPAGEDVGRCREAFAESLARTIAALEPLGVTTVVEALNGDDLPRSLVQTHDDVVAAIDASSARVQYDVYHQAKMGRDVVADLRDDIARIAHIQFADSPGRHEPGTGGLDFDAIFGAIRTSAYRGVVAAEYRPLVSTGASLAWLRRGAPLSA